MAHAQVSEMSVLRALNNTPGVTEETRPRVLKAAHHIEYIPPPHSRAGDSKIVALISEITSIYLNEAMGGMSSVVEQFNHGTAFYSQRSARLAERANCYLSFLNTGNCARVGSYEIAHA